MIQRVRTIALASYRESVRARILLGLAGVAFGVSVFSLVIASFTLNNAPRVVSDLGSASISLFSVVVAIVIGATSLYRELEQKTIFPILARPISRGEYVVGKYLGVLLTIGTFIVADTGLVLVMAALVVGRSVPFVVGGALVVTAPFAILAWRRPKWRTFGIIPWALVFLAYGIFIASVSPEERRLIVTQSFLAMLEIAIVTALATLLSSFSSPFLSALLTIWVWIIGRSADSFEHFPKKFFGPSITAAAKLFGKAIPNLQLYVPPRPLLTGEAPVDRFDYVVLSAATAAGWSIALVALAVIVFRRRDFL